MSLQIIKSEADQFGNTESSGKTEVEHGAIPSAGTCRRFRSIKQGLQLFMVEITDKGLVRFFEGDRQDTSHLFDSGGNSILRRLAGRVEHLAERAAEVGRRWLHGVRNAARVFLS